jgi:hypothetical protein
MVEFLVESYVARADRGAPERARKAAERLARAGAPIRFLRSIYLPVEETCFYLYEAGSADDVRAAARAAAIPFGQVFEADSERTREKR